MIHSCYYYPEWEEIYPSPDIKQMESKQKTGYKHFKFIGPAVWEDLSWQTGKQQRPHGTIFSEFTLLTLTSWHLFVKIML